MLVTVIKRLALALIMSSFTSHSFADFSPEEDLGDTGQSIEKPSWKFIRVLNGFEPERLSKTKLVLFPGVVAHRAAKELVASDKKLIINMASNGLNGLDTGRFSDGVGYYIYLLRNGKTKEIGAVASSAISLSKVTTPTGFNAIRKLPWGFVAMHGQIPPFHLSYWPKPFTRFTDAASSEEWRALDTGKSRVFSEIDLSRWIPDNARMAYILCEVGNTGEMPGNASIRVSGEQKDGLVVGSSAAKGQTSSLALHQRINSDRKFYYKVTGGATLSIYVLGYSNTESS